MICIVLKKMDHSKIWRMLPSNKRKARRREECGGCSNIAGVASAHLRLCCCSTCTCLSAVRCSRRCRRATPARRRRPPGGTPDISRSIPCRRTLSIWQDGRRRHAPPTLTARWHRLARRFNGAANTWSNTIFYALVQWGIRAEFACWICLLRLICLYEFGLYFNLI